MQNTEGFNSFLKIKMNMKTTNNLKRNIKRKPKTETEE